MKPVSEQLAEMSATAKDVEDAVAQARRERRERVDAMVSEARANADAVAARIDADVDATQSALVEGWRGFRDNLRDGADRMKADIADRKHERDAGRAQADAEAAESRAEHAIAVATVAIWNAREMALDAIAARAEADSYQSRA